LRLSLEGEREWSTEKEEDEYDMDE
jgi:hypothetical protein